MTHRFPRAFVTAGCAVLVLSACGAMPRNRGLESVHQPVVEQQTYTIDLATSPGGLPFDEQRRLGGWFDALGLGYGDRISVDDPSGNPATRETIAALAGGRGVLLAEAAAPVTGGDVPFGAARVVMTRFRAHVPGCPDWSAKSDVNLTNATYPNFGCAVNGNLAAMVADPADLIRGAADTGTTVTMTGSKAIAAYREAQPTGRGGLPASSSTDGASDTGGGGSGGSSGGGSGGGSGP